MATYIKHISYYLPEQLLTNDDISRQFPEWPVEKISNKTGISARPTSQKDEFSSDMAVKAAEKLFAEYNIDRSTIDYLLLCTQTPDYLLPTTACILQEKLGLDTAIGALDFNLGCSGFVYGLSLAKGLIEGGMAKNVLLITAETYTKLIHPKDKSNLTIFGDAAAATLIGNNGMAEIKKFVFGTDGKGYENLIVKQGFKYQSVDHSDDLTDDYGNVRNDKTLYMNGSAIFNFTNEIIPKLVEDVLKENKLNEQDVDLYVFHQANLYMLNHLRKKLHVSENRFFVHINQCANTVSSTIPIALKEAANQKKTGADTTVMLAGFGVGYSWAGCIIEY